MKLAAQYLRAALCMGAMGLASRGQAQEDPPRIASHFSSLDPLDLRGQLGISTSVRLSEDDAAGTPLRVDFSTTLPFTAWIQLDQPVPLGLHAKLAVTKRVGASRSASALSNLDVSAFHARPLASPAWWFLRAGILLPTADEDAESARLNRSVMAQSQADTVLFQPGALGVRLSSSVLVPETPCLGQHCAVRLDAGLDVYAPFAQGLQAAPRWGMGVALRTHAVLATLEYTGRLTPRAASTVQHTLGATLALSRGPALSLRAPLGETRWSAFVVLDFLHRFSP